MKTNKFSSYDMILIIISLLSYILDTISGNTLYDKFAHAITGACYGFFFTRLLKNQNRVKKKS